MNTQAQTIVQAVKNETLKMAEEEKEESEEQEEEEEEQVEEKKRRLISRQISFRLNRQESIMKKLRYTESLVSLGNSWMEDHGITNMCEHGESRTCRRRKTDTSVANYGQIGGGLSAANYGHIGGKLWTYRQRNRGMLARSEFQLRILLRLLFYFTFVQAPNTKFGRQQRLKSQHFQDWS